MILTLKDPLKRGKYLCVKKMSQVKLTSKMFKLLNQTMNLWWLVLQLQYTVLPYNFLKNSPFTVTYVQMEYRSV